MKKSETQRIMNSTKATVRAGDCIGGTQEVPGDKSISHRVAMFSGIAEGTSRIIGLAYFLCLVNLASAQAFWQFLRGRKQVIWKPRT